eukprot:scaffold6136_cov135-Skeletonema_dohrnii-CCMP3373.AAC.3
MLQRIVGLRRRLNLVVADTADGPAVWNARVAAGKSSSNTRAVLIMVALLLWKSGIHRVSVACEITRSCDDVIAPKNCDPSTQHQHQPSQLATQPSRFAAALAPGLTVNVST